MSASPTTGAAMHIYARLTSGLDALTEWSNTAHHRESLARPGWLAIRRFAAVHVDGCEPHDGFDLLTVIELETSDAAALIADHSYTPTPMPTAIVGLKAARAVYETLADDVPARDLPASGAAMLYVTIDLAPSDDAAFDAWRARDPLTPALRDAGCVGVARSQWITTSATTLARTTLGPRVLEQYEIADVAMLDRVAQLVPGADATGTTRSAYRQVFPASGAYSVASNSNAET